MTVEITRLGIDISAQASIASVLWRPNEAEPPSLSAFAFATANRFAKSRLPRICYAFVRGSSRIKLTQQNPSPSLPLAPVRALNTRRIEPVPFVNNQSPMKRSTSPSIIKAVLFTYSMFTVTSFLSDEEGAGADGVGATAANDAARYHLGLQSTSGDRREKKIHKIGTKRGAGRP